MPVADESFNDLQREYVALLGRRAMPEDGDDERLSELTRLLQLSPNAAMKDARLVAEVERLLGDYERLAVCQKDVNEAADAWAAHREESKRIERERKAERDRLAARHSQRQADYSRSRRVRDELAGIFERNPGLLRFHEVADEFSGSTSS